MADGSLSQEDIDALLGGGSFGGGGGDFGGGDGGASDDPFAGMNLGGGGDGPSRRCTCCSGSPRISR